MLNIKTMDLEQELKYITRIIGEVHPLFGVYHESTRHPVIVGREFYYENGLKICNDIDLSTLHTPICDVNGRVLLSREEIRTNTYSFKPFLAIGGAELLSQIVDLYQYLDSDFGYLYYRDELLIDDTALIPHDIRFFNGSYELLLSNYPFLSEDQNQTLFNNLYNFIENLFITHFSAFMKNKSSFYKLDITKRLIRLQEIDDIRLVRYEQSKLYLNVRESPEDAIDDIRVTTAHDDNFSNLIEGTLKF